MNLLHRLSLSLNTWCISVEEEVGYIDLHIMSSLCFELDRRILKNPYIPTPVSLSPGTPTPRAPLSQAPSNAPSLVPETYCIPRGGRIWWMTPADFLLLLGIGFFSFISASLGSAETVPTLYNISVMCLAWYLCGSFSIDYHKHMDHVTTTTYPVYNSYVPWPSGTCGVRHARRRHHLPRIIGHP